MIIWNRGNGMGSCGKDRFTVDYEPLFFFSKSKKYFFEQQLEPHIWADRDYRSKIPGGIKSKGKTATGIYSMNKVAYGALGRNKRSVWRIPTKPFPDAHFAVFPEALVQTPILAGCPERGIVLDPFFGAGTTGLVALKLNRNFIGIELSKEYIKIAEDRLRPFRNKLFN